MREKLSEDFKITEPKKIKLKVKIINISEEEIKLEVEKLINTINKQNNIDGREERFYIKVVKEIIKEKRDNNTRARGGRKG